MIPPNFQHQLATIVGPDCVLSEAADCWPYGYDNSRRHAAPELVAFATTATQVRDIVLLCNEHKVALVARGRGTGTTGATVPLHGGVVLSLERMNRIISVDPDNRVIVVEPGVTNQEVQDAAGKHGFFWPPDPTSAAYCTVGGNLAYNSAGPRAVKYGTPRENTLGLRAVTGAGDEVRLGVYTTKGVVGYDLTRLVIGSEGTLAIITEATLKLTPLPEAKRTLRVIYSTMRAAAKAVSRIMAQPMTPCALEFIDGRAIEMIRNYSDAQGRASVVGGRTPGAAKTSLPVGAGALLIVEVDGAQVAMDEAVAAITRAAQGDGLLDIQVAHTQQEVHDIWATRKALSPALRTIAPKKINEDIVVPVSRMPELIEGLELLSQEFDITIVNFGHAGNGNIHVNLLVDPANAPQMHRAEKCLDRMFSLVLQLNGTLSGEHGVGIEKRDFIDREIDPPTLKLMRQIKTQFDPKGILNPDKMFPLHSEEL